ncbi:oligosaccharide flippase family protein [Vibrio campbellii]|uniref:oligosaccharide flippase family protein n=1 Tax=Vibrio campbellii TaxID=680 RepID=UPI0005EDB28A|nr:oligosaccharide flippase family protein [Vibrio campbellii]
MNEFFNKEIKVIKSFINLGFIQFVNLLSPLVVYPYLIRCYGLEQFGTIAFHQGLVGILAIVINYGFYITGAKDIAKEKKENWSLVVSNIFIIKIILWLVCFLLVLIVIEINIPLIDNRLLLLCFFATFYELLFVQWFFQGVQDLKWITIINLASKVILTILCLYFIDKDASIYVYPTIYAIVNLISGLLTLFIMFYRYEIRLVGVNKNSLIEYFLDSSSIFLSNIVVCIKDRGSTILIGACLGMSSVAVYDLGLRILNLMSVPASIFSDAIFPKAVRIKSASLLKKSIFLVFSCSFLMCTICWVFMDFIVNVFAGKQLLYSSDYIRLMTISLPLMAVSTITARLGLLVFELNKEYFKSMAFAVIYYTVIISIGYVTSVLDELIFYILLMISTYAVELIFRVYYVRHRKII